MIPLHLKLENFMTYSEAELDFRSFRIACLAGNNGAGKSTILDALTWSLFDSSRAHDSEELIRLGQPEMRAELSFALEGRVYRVIRSRRRKGKGKSSGKASLEFQLQAEDGYRSLSGKKMSETQARIEQTLRMNYDLFVNSSFILQGRADAFTTASPAERKRVLADILQLEAYERMRTEAIETRRELRARESALRTEMSRSESELGASEHLEAHLGDARAHQKELRARLEQLEAARERLSREAEAMQQQAYALNQRERELAQLESRRSSLSSRRDEQLGMREAVTRWLEHADQIEAGFARLQAAEARLREQEADYERYRGLEAEHLRLQTELERRRHALDLQRQQAAHALESLARERARLETVLKDSHRIEAGHARWREALAQENGLAQQQGRWQALERELAAARQERELARQRHQLAVSGLNAQRDDLRARLAEGPALAAEQAELLRQLEALALRQTRLEEVQARGLELKHEQEHLIREGQRLSLQQEGQRKRIAQLQSHIHDAECPLCERLLTPADLDLLIRKYEQEFTDCENERLALQPQIHQLEQEILSMRREYQQIARELKPREELQTRSGSLAHRLDVLARDAAREPELSDEIAQREHAQAELDARLSQVISAHEQEQASLDYSPEALSLAQAAVRDWQWAESRQRELSAAREALPGLEADLQARRDALAALPDSQASDFEPELRASLHQAQSELASLAGLPAARAELQRSIQELSSYSERHAKLQEARIRSESLETTLRELEAEISAAEAERQSLLSELASLRDQGVAAAELAGRREQLEQEYAGLAEQERSLHAEIFSLEKELEGLAARRQALSQQGESLRQLLYEIQLYDVLEDSFGKNGLQAVLIENALPEIEQIANDMLAGMSEGRMHIKLQTLRSLKSKDKLAETLDILISDELGTRSYETFSAGEAFRVNFALRLAISKLLARRAGARLQTLVIDEGFGSQDAEGKTRLIEAINAVAADFATILVITHVDELKALFPCRIEVEKAAGGSRIRVMHV